MYSNTFEIERRDDYLALWVWETGPAVSTVRLAASVDMTVGEARELAAMLTEFLDKDSPTEHANAKAEFEEDLRRESMYDFMTSPMEGK